LRIDLDGRVVEGDWPVPPGIPLHLELHKLRADVGWAVHNHPRYGTVWADAARIPGCFDQSSALGGGELVIVDEYDGPVNDRGSAARAVCAMGAADMALLVNHGVFMTAGSIRAAHQRAVALEYRSWRAWHTEALGGSGRELPEPARSFFRGIRW
jgi:L-ribulose-5-phosphate 4-epimerase